MTEKLKEYRAFLPAEILYEIDNKGKKDNEPHEQRGAVIKSFRASSGMKEDDKKSQHENKQRSNSVPTTISLPKSDVTGKKGKIDALAIGLELLEGYTMVFVSIHISFSSYFFPFFEEFNLFFKINQFFDLGQLRRMRRRTWDRPIHSSSYSFLENIPGLRKKRFGITKKIYLHFSMT